MHILLSMWDDLLNLLVPTACVGCGAWDTPLCSECFAVVDNRHAVRVTRGTRSDLCGYSLGKYDGALRQIIVTIKHNSSVNLASWLYEAGHQLAGAFEPDEPVCVTPVPSGFTRRWRGMLVTPVIGQGVVDGLNARGAVARLVDSLRMPIGTRTQAGSNKHQREQRRHALTAEPTTSSHLIVDDVITTGTTIRSAASAVEEAGGQVLGFITLANVPTQHHSR